MHELLALLDFLPLITPFAKRAKVPSEHAEELASVLFIMFATAGESGLSEGTIATMQVHTYRWDLHPNDRHSGEAHVQYISTLHSLIPAWGSKGKLTIIVLNNAQSSIKRDRY